MAFEVVDTGAASSVVDIPSLHEIENDDPERARERLSEFHKYTSEVVSEYKNALDEGSGRDDYRRILETVNEIGSAMIRARKQKKVELETELMHMQGDLAHEFMQDFPDEMIVPPNPYISKIGLHEYADNVMRDNTLEEEDKERLMNAMIKEAENNDLDISKPLDIGKESMMVIGQQILDPEVTKVYQSRIDAADKVVIIKKSAEEEEEEQESFLWRGVKWVGKKLLGFAGRVLGRVALYTALGGAGAYLIHRYAPGAVPVIRRVLDAVAPEFTAKVAKWTEAAVSWGIRNWNAVRGFFSSIF